MGTTTEQIISFLHNWQTLAGAFIGASIPVIVALVIHPIRSRLETRKERKEALRQIEIYTSEVINNIAKRLEDWSGFLERVRGFSEEDITNRAGVTLTNVPILVDIDHETKLLRSKTKDLILHNFLLNLGSWVKEFNAFLYERRRAFLELQEVSKTEFDKARAHRDQDPGEVMRNYNSLLAGYADITEKSLYGTVRNGVEVVTIVKSSAEISTKSNFGSLKKRWRFRFSKEFKEYKELQKRISIDNYGEFQEIVAIHFNETFLKCLKLFLNKTRVLKLRNIQPQNHTADTASTTSEINQMVYKLYNLTPEEIKIIEESK